MITFGSPLRRYDVVTSTQDVARDLFRSGEGKPGAVITAMAMTAGRGRLGRTWHVPPGANVCLTAIGTPIRADTAWQLALVAGLAVTEAVDRVAPDAGARCRFPNDVYAADRKVAGVLIETTPAPTAGSVVPLIGIGVNVRAGALPSDVAARATSLEAATGRTCDVANVEAQVLESLTACWHLWETSGMDTVLERWAAHSDPQARRAFVIGGRSVEAWVDDLTPDGTLTLVTDDGMTHRLPVAQIILGD